MTSRDHRFKLFPTAGILMAILVFMAGCASYSPKPLPEGFSLSPTVEATGPYSAPERPMEKGLTLDQVASLAVRNNPDLKAKQKQLGVAEAQLYSAGLLPDPQISAGFDFPMGSDAGLVNAYGLGLAYDIIPLINRGARVESERAATKQVTLQLLWDAWQVSQQARTLAVRWVGEERQLQLLRRMRGLYEQRYHRSSEAMKQGDLTLGVTGTDLTALLDSLSQINQLEQTHNDTGHALHLLLGLSPEVPLPIQVPAPPPLMSRSVLDARLSDVCQHRPDLLALKAGYQSQEAKVRAAILSQFPSVSIGISRARDTSSVDTGGFTIGLTLPLFSGSCGAIAVERATRERLRVEYQARIDQTAVDIDKLYRLQSIVADQRARLDEYLPDLGRYVEQARGAYQRNDIDALTFLNMEMTWINKRLERIQLDQAQWETAVALQTLLAIPSGPAGQPPPTHGPQPSKGENAK
jgi:cobalt-zinc-cadmium efflux system outer membrane protein